MRGKNGLGWVSTLLAVLLAGGAVSLAAQVETQSRTFVLGSGEDSWIGVEVQDVTSASAQRMKLPGVYGATVESVEPGSPAAKAGIQKDDVILQFAGERVLSIATLRRLVSETPAGRTVPVEISRNGETENLSVTVGKAPGGVFSFSGRPFAFNWRGPEALPTPEAPGVPRLQSPEPKFKVEPLPNPRSEGPDFNFRFFISQPVLGISGDDLTPQLAKYFGVKQGKGVLVREVTAGSPADKAGIRAGDVIAKVDSKEVGSVEQLRDALGHQGMEPRKVMLTIVRNREELMVSVEIEPYQRQEMRDIEALKNHGTSRDYARQMARLAEEYKLRSGAYQKELEHMQQRLRDELLPYKQELRGQLEQLRIRVQEQIRHEMKLRQQLLGPHVV